MTKRALTLLALIVASGCVTINVYFPAVAAERAADQVIDDVWGFPAPDGAGPADPSEDAGEPQSQAGPAATGLALLAWLVPAAHAAEPEINISAPAVRRIINSMEARHSQLAPYYDSGAVGLTGNATLAVRDMGAVPLAKRNTIKQLVAAENEDRNALYREIAVANGHPEWESDIRAIFADRWIERARGGWYYQSGGGWAQK